MTQLLCPTASQAAHLSRPTRRGRGVRLSRRRGPNHAAPRGLSRPVKVSRKMSSKLNSKLRPLMVSHLPVTCTSIEATSRHCWIVYITACVENLCVASAASPCQPHAEHMLRPCASLSQLLCIILIMHSLLLAWGQCSTAWMQLQDAYHT